MREIGYHGNSIAFSQNGQFGLEIKILLSNRKATVESHLSGSVEKRRKQLIPLVGFIARVGVL